MKKTFFALVGCLCLCCFLACGQEPAQEAAQPAPIFTATSASTPAPTSEPTPEPTPAPVLVNGQTVPADAESLVLAEPVSDPDALRQGLLALEHLKAVTLDRAVPEEGIAAWVRSWAALEAELPKVAFAFRDLYRGAASDAVTDFSLTALQAAPEEELTAIFSLFPNLKTLDLKVPAGARETAARAAALAPAVTVTWDDETFGPSESAWETVTLTAPVDSEAVRTYLACFPRLREADLMAAGLTEAEGDALCEAFPQVAFHRMVTLNGQPIDSFTEELDLSRAQIQEYETFSAALGHLPRLRRLEMHQCSLTNQQLAALRDRYPDTKIVWTVKMSRWEIRTDVVAFSTKQHSNSTKRLSSAYAQVLQYCTDLVALDLGHNAIDDLSWLEPLQKLQVLILADNSIRDITPLASLKRLKYVELFMNTKLQDVTPLAALPELLDVNLCITHTKDLSPLMACKKLERIWIGHQTQKYCSKESLQALLEAFPDAQYDLVSVSCTNRGWREHPRYDAYSEMFRTNTAVAPFLPEG